MISLAIKTPVASLYSSRVHNIAWVLSLRHLSDPLKEEFTLRTQMIKSKSSKRAQGVKGSLGTWLDSVYTSRHQATSSRTAGNTEWSLNFACSHLLFCLLSSLWTPQCQPRSPAHHQSPTLQDLSFLLHALHLFLHQNLHLLLVANFN